jgi:hypothetical protein
VGAGVEVVAGRGSTDAEVVAGFCDGAVAGFEPETGLPVAGFNRPVVGPGVLDGTATGVRSKAGSAVNPCRYASAIEITIWT